MCQIYIFPIGSSLISIMHILVVIVISKVMIGVLTINWLDGFYESFDFQQAFFTLQVYMKTKRAVLWQLLFVFICLCVFMLVKNLIEIKYCNRKSSSLCWYIRQRLWEKGSQYFINNFRSPRIDSRREHTSLNSIR